MFEYVLEYLKINDVEYKKDFNLKNISPIRIGALAKVIAYPDTEGKLVSLVSFLEKSGCKYRVLGRMSNVLPPDKEYQGVIIRTDRLNSVKIDQESVFSEAGASLPFVANFASEHGVSGFEELAGIPGSIGGATVGNAGAFGREISDLILSTRCYLIDADEVVSLSMNDINFAYRSSGLKSKNCLVLSCRFKIKLGSIDVIKSAISKYNLWRKEHQPIDKPSLGSTFKRPRDGVSAGELIDSCGLKGFSCGGAEISTKHAGFIINSGDASAEDYLKVADTAQKTVFERFKIELVKEIEVIS